MAKNRILVIGGNGFIGKNVVSNLLEHGYEPVIYDIVESELNVEQYTGDLLTDLTFENIIKSCDKIIYLITSVSPKKSMEEPTSAYISDIPLLIKTLDTCVKNGIKRVVYASSGGTVYGEGNGKLFREDDQTYPINHYAICKISCEKILNLYNNLYGMENISLRISNPYGIGQNPKSGVGAVTTFAHEILNNNPIKLFGDGQNYRDYVDIESVSEAFRLSCDWEYDESIFPVFNIGSGEPLSLNDVVEIITDSYNMSPRVEYLDSRPFDVKYSALDTSKAERYLKYQSPHNQRDKIKQYVLKLRKHMDSDLRKD